MLTIKTADNSYEYKSFKQNAEITLAENNPKEYNNFLAERISLLSESQTEVIAYIASKNNITSAADLIDISYNTTNYCHANAKNYFQLGNQAVFEDTNIPENLKKLIDKELYGIEYHGKMDGCFCSAGYITTQAKSFTPAIIDGKLPDMFSDIECLLKVKIGSIHSNGDDAVWVKMPMTGEKSLKLADRFGQAHECKIYDIESCVPELNSYLPEASEIEQLSKLGWHFEDCDDTEIEKFNAVLEFTENSLPHESIADFLNIFDSLDCYCYMDSISDEYEHGKVALKNQGIKYDEELDDYIDFEGFGKDTTQNEKGKITSYGYIALSDDLPEPKYESERKSQGMCQSM